MRRGRAEEAKDILTYLEEFKDKAALADIFMEPSKVGVECIARIMYSLTFIIQHLHVQGPIVVLSLTVLVCVVALCMYTVSVHVEVVHTQLSPWVVVHTQLPPWVVVHT